ncbi:hypothetical protein B0H10DRAFT_2063395 [Mycena sp. CBHHK59/15]|nr:hypothetical protein B0H10DRAFT_2096596 [Mycena sp. CBHHK59/15]KAJ6609692.1 hypothetical protein B0H10DRAFT_2063395 [Mycena sp. CBHHK59/15]
MTQWTPQTKNGLSVEHPEPDPGRQDDPNALSYPDESADHASDVRQAEVNGSEYASEEVNSIHTQSSQGAFMSYLPEWSATRAVGAFEDIVRWLPYSPFVTSARFKLRRQYSIPRTITPQLSSSVRSLVGTILNHHRSRNPLVVYTTALIVDESTLLLCIAAQKSTYRKQQCLQATIGSLDDLEFSFIFKDAQLANLWTPDWPKLVTWQDFHDLSLTESSSYTPNVRSALWNIGNVKGQISQDLGPHAYIEVQYDEEGLNDGFYSIRSGPVDMDGPQKLEAIFDLDENHTILGSLVTRFEPSITENKIDAQRMVHESLPHRY